MTFGRAASSCSSLSVASVTSCSSARSSTIEPAEALGLGVRGGLLDDLDLHCSLLSRCAGRGMRQRDRVPIRSSACDMSAEFMSPSCGVRRRHASPAHTRGETRSRRTLSRVETIEFLARRLRASASRRSSMWPVDMRQLAGEAGARVERAVRSDRVRVLHVHVARARCARRRASESRDASSRRAETSSCRRGSCTCRRSEPPPAPTDVMQVPFSGLPFRRLPTGVSGMMPFGRGTAASRTIGLKFTFTSLSANSCCRRNSSSAGIAVRPSSRRSCRRSRSGTRPATRRMFSTMRSNVPWPPRSGRMRLCVSRSPSSVILMPVQSERQQPIDDLRREQQAVGDDADRHARRRAPASRPTAARRGRTSPAGSAAARRRRT